MLHSLDKVRAVDSVLDSGHDRKDQRILLADKKVCVSPCSHDNDLRMVCRRCRNAGMPYRLGPQPCLPVMLSYRAAMLS